MTGVSLRPPPSALALGVCVLPDPPANAPRVVQDAVYIHEMLGHVGIGYRTCALESLIDDLESGLRLLVTVGELRFGDEIAGRLSRWVEDEGGAWISIGGLCGMEDLLGASYAPAEYVLWGGSLRNLGEGYLDAGSSAAGHPILTGLTKSLHYFGGIAVEARAATTVLCTTLDAHGRTSGLPAVVERVTGSGRCLLLAPDITGSVVRIQQGTAITRDGVPAPDGTAPVSDGVLKSDDGQVLDWLLDRDAVAGAPGLSAFLHPIADGWRDLLLRTIFYAASAQKIVLPLLWYWPNGLDAVGHISHDSDGNVPGQAWQLLGTLRDADARATWCIILPGYEPEIIEAIRADGHELATHFNALDDGCPWNETLFDSQWRLLSEMFGQDAAPVSNKNHYLRWEGDTELWEWCVARGIRLDQSKGASKTGEAGFNFGTCHPYRPITSNGAVLPVHELATPTQDLCIFAPEEIVPPLLDAVVRHYGILHLLFHPNHIEKPGVADSLVSAVRAGRERGLGWWTARDIVIWEEARRAACWSADGALAASEPLPGATMMYLAPPNARLIVEGEEISTRRIERWGFQFESLTRDIPAGESLSVTVTVTDDTEGNG